jgi:phage terminase small subunit
MKQRGRKTAGALEAAVSTQRPAPLKHLTPEGKDIWMRVVNALQADWFRQETLDLLAEYCEQVLISRKIGKMILKLPLKDSGAEMERLIRLKEKTARLTITLSTKMRISQQATYDKSRLKEDNIATDDPWSQS